MTVSTRFARILLATVAMTSVIGCAATGPLKDGPKELASDPIAVRSPDSQRVMQDAVNFLREKPLTVLETDGSSSFTITREAGDEVPDVVVGQVNAAPMKFGALISQIAQETGMGWRISGAGADALMQREVYFVQRTPTSLEDVLNELSEITGAFYTVEGDRIIFSQDDLFVARVPRMTNSQDVLVAGLGNLGATEIFADVLSGTVTFRATRPAFAAAKRLMESMEGGRDMIVYDFWLVDRSLNDSTGIGVDLGVKRAGGNPSGAFSIVGSDVVSALSGGTPIGLTVAGTVGAFDITSAISFLRALGDTETLARPTISLLSGGSSSFSAGEKSEYIRSITLTGGSDTDNALSGTDVQSLEVGVKIDLTGSHNNGVISTDFVVDVSELLAFEEFDSGTVRLRLPKTSNRTIEAHLEARPGDVMILGGIIRDRQDLAGTETPVGGIPLSRRNASTKTETIILVRPRLVQIRPAAGSRPVAEQRVSSGVSEGRRENPISGVIEDEKIIDDILAQIE